MFLIDFLIHPHIILSADEDGLTPFSLLPYFRKKILWNHIDRIDRTVYMTHVSHHEMLVIYLRKNSECHYPSNPFNIILKKNLTHHGNADIYIPLQKLVATDVLKALMPYLYNNKNDKT